jgi:trigger factor
MYKWQAKKPFFLAKHSKKTLNLPLFIKNRIMNITKQDLDVLNAVVTIEVGPADYEQRVEDALKKVQRQANMPGFRPGKVPVGMVKKMYGKNILADELNKMLNDSIHKYITENKLEILGNPLPKADEQVDFEAGKNFTFKYDIGLAPSFEVEVSDKVTFDYMQVKVDDALIDKYIKDVRKNYGTPVNPEVAGEKDVVFVDINELDETGAIKAGGIFKSTSLGLERLKSETAKKKLIGVKKEDKIILTNKELYEDPIDASVGLGIDKEAAENLNCNLQLTVKNIARMEDAELNEELFNKVYGEGTIKTEEEFRNKIKDELDKMFEQDSDRKFYESVEKTLVDKINPALPEEFLKRWLMAVNDKPVTLEQIEKEFESWSRMMKWKLIENKIAKKHDLQVSNEEALEEAKRFVHSQYARYGQTPDAAEVEKVATDILKKDKEAEKIYENVFFVKSLNLFKNNFKLNNKEVSYNEFFGIKE